MCSELVRKEKISNPTPCICNQQCILDSKRNNEKSSNFSESVGPLPQLAKSSQDIQRNSDVFSVCIPSGVHSGMYLLGGRGRICWWIFQLLWLKSLIKTTLGNKDLFGTGYDGREVVAAGAWGGWSHRVQSKKAENKDWHARLAFVFSNLFYSLVMVSSSSPPPLMFMGVSCVYVYALCLWLVLEETRRNHHIPWNWSHRWM